MTTRENIVETINKLFIYTDSKNWIGLQEEVFSEIVFLDMMSLGGSAEEMSSKSICDIWNEGFKNIDHVNHLAGNYLVTIKTEKEASVFAYATATHFKESAKNGKTREFVGTYDFKLRLINDSWKIYSFTYNLKYLVGNLQLK